MISKLTVHFLLLHLLSGEYTMANFERIINLLGKYCDRIAQAAVMAMMLLVVANIVGRPLGTSIFGTLDFVGFINAVLVAFALAYCAIHKGHIQVEMLVQRLPERVQSIIDIFTNVLSLGIFAVITWQCLLLAIDKLVGNEVSITALVPFHYYIFAVAFGCALLCMVILINLIKSVLKVVNR